MSDLPIFLGVVLVVLVGGAVLGMLMVPRLERLSEPPDEDPGAGDDPAHE